MIEIKGKYNTAIVYNDTVDENAISQIIELLNSPMAEHSKIRIMPDVHAGAGCVIGYTATLTDEIIPNLIGVDIGCGVCGWNLGKINIDYSTLDKFIRHLIPSGRNVHKSIKGQHINSLLKNKIHDFYNGVADICHETDQDNFRVMASIGTLGGGNHFIEIDADAEGNKWLLIHSGSRNFGLKIANYHQKIAKNKHKDLGQLAYLEGQYALDYFSDMEIAQKYASLNRRVMGKIILEGMFKLNYEEPIESIHNYINFEDRAVRKGAISAHKGEQVFIPLNMRDGTILGVGKGNKEWNYSAPHGAGRLMSRTKAKEEISLDLFKEAMKDVWTSCVSKNTLDESPFAYKDAEEIIKYLEPSVKIVNQMKPVYNFKAPE